MKIVSETPKSSNNRTRKATAKISNMNEAASKFHVNMLGIQKKLAQKQYEVLDKKVSLLKRREVNQKLKSKVLKKQLGKLKIITPEMIWTKRVFEISN